MKSKSMKFFKVYIIMNDGHIVVRQEVASNPMDAIAITNRENVFDESKVNNKYYPKSSVLTYKVETILEEPAPGDMF